MSIAHTRTRTHSRTHLYIRMITLKPLSPPQPLSTSASPPPSAPPARLPLAPASPQAAPPAPLPLAPASPQSAPPSSLPWATLPPLTMLQSWISSVWPAFFVFLLISLSRVARIFPKDPPRSPRRRGFCRRHRHRRRDDPVSHCPRLFVSPPPPTLLLSLSRGRFSARGLCRSTP